MDLVLTLFLAGDLMLGRGIDHILPHSVDPTLHEPYVTSAATYVEIAEQRTGPIERPVSYEYIWGDALAELKRVDPAVRIVNVETAVTTSDDHWEGKGIHYRMHPRNVEVLTVAGIDAAVLANNHALDWGYAGLAETIQTLKQADVQPVGAGETSNQAAEPAILATEDGRRVLVFACAMPDSGVYSTWAARQDRGGVNYLSDLSDHSFKQVQSTIERFVRSGDLIVFSVHWGGNWGYDIPQQQIDFARRLIDHAGVDIVHGHSSHHVKGIEIYRGRLILYGAGDLINDYEGIRGHEEFRPDLSLIYFPTIDARSGELGELRLVPMQIRYMRLNRASAEDTRWMRRMLNRQSRRFGVQFEIDPTGHLIARWEKRPSDKR